jgi:short-subunit dehydrogenase
MKKKIALIFGHRGGIGSAVKTACVNAGYRVIPVNRSIIDFDADTSDQEIASLLTNAQPDIVINAAGIFVNGYDKSHTSTMNINVGSNWSIIRHYAKPHNQNNPTRIIMVGSSSYTGGRKLYPLYSASKAALYNLWQSAKEQFENTTISIDLLNPVRTLTKMSTAGKTINPDLDYLTPEQVAEQIILLIEQNQSSRCIDMTFEDKK